MPGNIVPGYEMGYWRGVPSNVEHLVNLAGNANRVWAGYSRNTLSIARDMWDDPLKVFDVSSPVGAHPPGKPQDNHVQVTMHQDFHYRVWAIPNEMSLRNPALGVNIPIKLWNTWPFPPTNTYVATSLLDLTGVTADILPGTLIRSFGYPTVNLQLNTDAGLKMNGLVQFEFVQGVGFLRLIVERASVVPVVPDAPVTEKWTWRSQVMVSENGTEQRVSLSPAPRKTTDFNLTVIYPDEANSVIKQLFGDSASAIVLPQYQYLAGLKFDAAVSSTVVVAPIAPGDLRPGSSVLIVDNRSGVSELNTVTSVVAPDIITLDTPLASNFRRGSWVVPAFATFLNRRTEFERSPADGYAKLSTQAVDADIQSPFVRPEAMVVLPTFNGLPLLEDRPIVVGGSVGAVYDSGINRLDYGGKLTVIAPWSHTQVELAREYLLDRFFSPTDLDRWRSFFDYTRGRTKPFYTPSFRPDLAPGEIPAEGAGQIKLSDNSYSSVFFGKTVFDQVAIYTAGGVHYTSILSASADEFNIDTITFATPLPFGPEWTDIERISFLMRCRMASDEVELEHFQLHSYIRFGIRTTDQ